MKMINISCFLQFSKNPIDFIRIERNSINTRIEEEWMPTTDLACSRVYPEFRHTSYNSRYVVFALRPIEKDKRLLHLYVILLHFILFHFIHTCTLFSFHL